MLAHKRYKVIIITFYLYLSKISLSRGFDFSLKWQRVQNLTIVFFFSLSSSSLRKIVLPHIKS